MKAKGRNYLRVTGFLEILVGVVSIILIQWILKQDSIDLNIYNLDIIKDALWVLILIYGFAGLKIITGIFGILYANNLKRYKTCYILGLLVIIIQTLSICTITFNVSSIISYGIIMIIPVYYLFGAIKNKQQFEQIK